MKQTLEEALKSADLERLIPRIESYADNLLRRKIWRGLKLEFGTTGQVLANGKSANDFVQDAFEALLNGTRTYEEGFDLEKNLKRTVESMIWNWNKKSGRRPLLDHPRILSEDGTEFDPIMAAVDPTSTEDSAAEKSERRALQKRLLEDFRASLEDDGELTELLDAYENGFEKPADIEELTGIPVKRIYELKRKLHMKFVSFRINHSAAEALEQ